MRGTMRRAAFAGKESLKSTLSVTINGRPRAMGSVQRNGVVRHGPQRSRRMSEKPPADRQDNGHPDDRIRRQESVPQPL
jgi:hypothetical protein